MQHENYTHGYAYDKKKREWRFHGYICCKCDKTVKSEKVLERHSKVCRGKPARQYPEESIPPIVKDQTGKDWQPYKVLKL